MGTHIEAYTHGHMHTHIHTNLCTRIHTVDILEGSLNYFLRLDRVAIKM